MNDELLTPMFEDEYYPDELVSRIKQLLLQFSEKITASSLSQTDIYSSAQEIIVQINKMKPKFEQMDSSLDDAAADYIAEAMMMVVQEAGYLDIDMEELVANREW
ncbi:DUF5713 family protein [Acinetobacter radioresistens]|jgi:Family of unknown function (DUF5713)|uniref:Uncharacterized protein n=1 Tax=Acinetobacter radioresistens SK82 TaxID=596318 RepID=A0ABM9YQE4_ACIRA|nr:MULTISPECIES: DUF5713 family protein [Acinetobacter]EET83345.1 hypothetical protein ACIRA0001_1053 [Acinetobacter radioresistens SK82]EEY88044.1 hypothetical protein HMPREF0018_00791 [Acinetobacter radioresistens SH164]ENV86884.1 hypothetical protein F940_00844 [Acinetobacter radioresistens NIPH 2130]EXB87115.1 hypothetical protein J538_0854 [Acinetobacter sp. 272263]EXE57722.1 hypothetical protein J579_1671 [Acinetobacter sp. 1239920]